MVFLQQQGIVFTADMLIQMLNVAGARNKLAAAQWLRQQGGGFAVLRYHSQPWSGDALLWARAEGCTSGTEWIHIDAIHDSDSDSDNE
jgi:hypothetical protein